jgi:uncharacterized membrane protein/predicted DsbA family dithiol-disulfide isomerase
MVEETLSPSKSAPWLVLFRAAVLLALMASAALYMQYLDPMQAAFCGLHSGCEAVRKSDISYFFGSRLISLPLFGLIAFAVLLAASLFAPRSLLTRCLAYAGAAGGAGFLGMQAAYIGAFCWLCCVVDACALLAAGFTLADARAKNAPDPLPIWAWASLAGIAISAPAVWVQVKPAPPVPASIRAFYEPNKINVVEFADFECPYCRRLHPTLQAVLHEYPPGEVHFVRKHVPLPGHEQALPAARADICAAQQGKGEELAERLVQIELSPSAVHRAAIEAGVNGAKLDECLASSEPDRVVDADTKLLQGAGMEGLPTTYVGGKRLLGSVSEAAVRDAFERAKRGAGDSGVPGPLYAAGLLGVIAGLVWLGRSARGTV